MRDARSGKLEASLRTDYLTRLNIVFDSETRVYSHHDTYRVPYYISSPESEDSHYDNSNTHLIVGNGRNPAPDSANGGGDFTVAGTSSRLLGNSPSASDRRFIDRFCGLLGYLLLPSAFLFNETFKS